LSNPGRQGKRMNNDGIRNDKDAQLQKLFSRYFTFGCITKYQENIGFTCPHRNTCGVSRSDPRYTPYLGDPDTPVMVIGEAPSGVKKNSGSVFCGGLFADVETTLGKVSLNISPVHWIRDFVRKEYGCIPYFTDLSKCGTDPRNPVMLKKRFDRCFDCLLKHEIEILKPRVILVVKKGLKYLDVADRIRESAPVVKFLDHYGGENRARHHRNKKTAFSLWKKEIRKGRKP